MSKERNGMKRSGNDLAPWQEPQPKVFVTERMVNEQNPTYMKKIYEKTTSKLFEGAKKAQCTQSQDPIELPNDQYDQSSSDENQNEDQNEDVCENLKIISDLNLEVDNRKQRQLRIDSMWRKDAINCAGVQDDGSMGAAGNVLFPICILCKKKIKPQPGSSSMDL